MKTLIPLIILVIVAGGVWYLLSNTPANPTSTETATTTEENSVIPTVVYTDTGFSPAMLTVPAGATVTFMNLSSQRMMVGSNPHPTHQEYDSTTRAVHCAAGYTGPLPFDECTAADPGASWSFTFTKAGTWGFHNHASPNDAGSVIVQ